MTTVTVTTVLLPRPTESLTLSPPPTPVPAVPTTSREASSPAATTSITPVRTPPILPLAAILILAIAAFVVVVIALLFIRKILKRKGLVGEWWCPECCSCPDNNEKCIQCVDAMDCSIPSCQVWLDRICPSKQQCGQTCSKVWSCYCCLVLAGACDDVQMCPNCSAMECPDCNCCGDCCHCTLKVPECSQVTCLCFECGRTPP